MQEMSILRVPPRNNICLSLGRTSLPYLEKKNINLENNKAPKKMLNGLEEVTTWEGDYRKVPLEKFQSYNNQLQIIKVSRTESSQIVDFKI